MLLGDADDADRRDPFLAFREAAAAFFIAARAEAWAEMRAQSDAARYFGSST